MYSGREFTYHGEAEPAPGDALKAVLCIMLVVSIMTAILLCLKHRAETATKAEARVMTEEVILP
jgi:hypothetical protein